MYETVTTTAARIRHITSDFNSLRRSQMLSFSWMRSIIARAKNFITSGYRQKNIYDNNRMNFEGETVLQGSNSTGEALFGLVQSTDSERSLYI